MTISGSGPGGGLASASPPRADSLAEKIYVLMREDILSATLRPGDLVLEGDLARRYGVSKTPVREALRQLSNLGWIQTIPRRGYLVRPLRLHDIKEVFELRLLLEPGLFAHAARGGDASHFPTLRALVERTAAEDPPDDSRTAPGREFHLAVLRMADNDRALDVVTNLLDEVRRLHHMMPEVRTHPDTEDVVDDHLAILEAMEARDADAVRDLVREHIQDSADRVMSAFRLAMG